MLDVKKQYFNKTNRLQGNKISIFGFCLTHKCSVKILSLIITSVHLTANKKDYYFQLAP